MDSHRITDLGESIQVHGIDYGLSKRPLPVHHRDYHADGDVVVCKIKGHLMWGGIGQGQHYSPARFLVLKLSEQNGETRGEPIVWFEIRK